MISKVVVLEVLIIEVQGATQNVSISTVIQMWIQTELQIFGL